mgnify:FL=1|jgi:hypothetical protein|tara:strand:- start:14350 stop:14694 length:345 start_codon:yes stop_codon:yes gene_type:complete
MSYSIYKKPLPIHILKEFLMNNAEEENNFYVINKIVYKKSLENNTIQQLYSILLEYYKDNKQFYLNREIDYTRFITIIRHICKFHSINIISQIKYDKNKYNIIYYFNKNNILDN